MFDACPCGQLPVHRTSSNCRLYMAGCGIAFWSCLLRTEPGTGLRVRYEKGEVVQVLYDDEAVLIWLNRAIYDYERLYALAFPAPEPQIVAKVFGRPRVYSSDAEKMRAYRQRKRGTIKL